MIIESRMDTPRDQFPVGMRVLAVDDDRTCLRLLETLLRRCRYHVTTTNQALTALKLLREKKDEFDLVISDVHMPDMDGFKLLELVGLEMDLPVIMLSANGDTKLVMQGVTHGACDYLVKPVRIEELKNIWQHVIRRKNFDTKDQSGAGNQDKPHEVNRLSGQVSGGTGDSEQNGKAIKRRKDQNEDEDEEQENGHDNDETTTQKKPRVVWSVELHHKFVAAVRQLGIDKAVPKKILDLMNVEKLTRENVASHLQKYRLYLKRISCQQNQANMVAALSGADPSYLSMGSLNGLGPLHNMTGSGHFQNSISGSFSPVGMLGRLNTSSGLGIHGLPSPGLVQLGQSKNLNNLMTEQIKFQKVLPRNLDGSMIQGTPVSLELDQLHQNGGVTCADDLQLAVDNHMVFTNCFPDSKGAINSCNPLLSSTNNTSMLDSQETRVGKTYENRSAALVGSLHSEFSSPMLDPIPGRCNEGWSSAIQSSTSSNCFRPATMHLQDNLSSMPFEIGNAQFQDSMREMNYHQVRSAPHILTNAPKQEWDDHEGGVLYNSNVLGRSVNFDSPANGGFYQLNQNADPKNSSFNVNRSNFDVSLHMNTDYVRKSIRETTMSLNQGYNMDQYKAQHGCNSNNSGSLEDLATSMMKQEQDKVNPMGEDFGCDIYSIESCM